MTHRWSTLYGVACVKRVLKTTASFPFIANTTARAIPEGDALDSVSLHVRQ